MSRRSFAARSRSTTARRSAPTGRPASTSSKPTPRPAPHPSTRSCSMPRRRRCCRGVRSPFAKSGLSLGGTLRNSAGVPAPGVPVRLIAQNAGESAPAVVATTTTDAAGHWVLNAPQGPSRKLTIVYGTQAPTPEGGVTISQSVKPTLTLRIRALGRARLRFTGRLGIAPLGTPRPLVVIQARNGRRWQAVGSAVRVTPSGRFTLTYQGSAPRPPRGSSAAATLPRRRTVHAVISHGNVPDQKDEGPLMPATTNPGRTRIACASDAHHARARAHRERRRRRVAGHHPPGDVRQRRLPRLRTGTAGRGEGAVSRRLAASTRPPTPRPGSSRRPRLTAGPEPTSTRCGTARSTPRSPAAPDTASSAPGRS